MSSGLKTLARFALMRAIESSGLNLVAMLWCCCGEKGERLAREILWGLTHIT